MRVDAIAIAVAVSSMQISGCRDRSGAGEAAANQPAAAATAPAEAHAAATQADDTPPARRLFDRPADALSAVLAEHPKARAFGFGEVHATTGDAPVASALQIFSAELLPLLPGHATDLVVETWAEYGRCGEAEEKVSADVKRDTERPPQTENEVVALLRRAKQLGMAPHYLPFDCGDYRQLLGEGGQVDYEKLLLLITERLRTAALELVAQDKVVALYGGSTHNDLYPYEAVADLSYAAAVRDRTGGGYVEVDLYVPELIAGDELLANEPWYSLVDRLPAGKVALIERGAGSYILLLAKTPRGARR